MKLKFPLGYTLCNHLVRVLTQRCFLYSWTEVSKETNTERRSYVTRVAEQEAEKSFFAKISWGWWNQLRFKSVESLCFRKRSSKTCIRANYWLILGLKTNKHKTPLLWFFCSMVFLFFEIYMLFPYIKFVHSHLKLQSDGDKLLIHVLHFPRFTINSNNPVILLPFYFSPKVSEICMNFLHSFEKFM